MDKATRNDIQRATQAARGLIEGDYREQLEGTFDILLDGTISEQPGSHLTERQKVKREKLVAAVAHKRSAGLKAKEAVDDYLREAAFTVLNRFVALKMLEARQLVQECVSKGGDSAGFKEFRALASGLVAVEDKGYRLYIETLFDEIGQEVKVLFDRHDVASLLWPDRQTLHDLLAILNAPELRTIWAEDETIGWIYQYFNGEKERTQMRKESQTPRNSRELAVRNQFFTPRYVVQFLTDNTLGRTWYEMMQGETKLADLEYLVRRPNEVFLVEDESTPDLGVNESGLSQENLIQQTAYVLFRAKKDPRDLRILDPACGSGHFLLYAFDLLITIYEEAWNDAGAAAFTETKTQLCEDFGSVEELRRAIPELILRQNLHGVDIDPRAAQIAALALWMRAQRAYNQFGLGRSERSPITKTNIVVAEPMPGDAELVEEFAAHLKPAVLGDLFKKMVDEMKLAGELGSLLKIEELIAKAVEDAAEAHRQGRLFAENVKSQKFWDRVDEKIISALSSFAEESAGSTGIRRQLFANDAVQGVAFVDLMRKRFDTVLMNPPFGDTTDRTLQILKSQYPAAKRNLYIGFVCRAAERLLPDGMLGAITDASFVHQTRYAMYRGDLLSGSILPKLDSLISFGWGVLDAYVETATIVLSRRSDDAVLTLDLRQMDDKEAAIVSSLEGLRAGRALIGMKTVSRHTFSRLPKSVLAFWLHAKILNLYDSQPSIDPSLVDARCGMSSSDNGRFYKVCWEIPPGEIGESGRWRYLANGGSPVPFLRQQVYVVNWGYKGREAKSRVAVLYGSASRTIINEQYYFDAGFTFGKRTDSFSAQVLPANQVFSNEGQAIFVRDKEQAGALLAFLNSSMVADLLNSIAGQHKEAGYVGSIPSPPPEFLLSRDVQARTEHAYKIVANCLAAIPESQFFTSPFHLCQPSAMSLDAVVGALRVAMQQFADLMQENDKALEHAIGFGLGDTLPWEHRSWTLGRCLYDVEVKDLRSAIASDIVGYLLGLHFGRWTASAKAVRSYELLDAMMPLAPPCGVGVASDSPGTLVDDVGHTDDIEAALKTALASLPSVSVTELTHACDALSSSVGDVRFALAKRFFASHINRYSKSRRKAPIYWQLATPSASYSVWCYYHRLTCDTFFRIANDYVTPKVDHEERKLNALRQEAGSEASSKQRIAIDVQETFVTELRAFKTELDRIAPLWNPNLNDGVIINFAPLWRLVPQHKPWQKECKKVWDKLVKGDYDWAHLAMHLWPERVVPKCQDDRSLAIAHGLEDNLWYEDEKGKWQRRQVSNAQLEELIAERSSTTVKAALKDLLEAPNPSGQTRRKRRART